MPGSNADGVVNDGAAASSSRPEGYPLVELKNGKVQLKQKSLSFEKQSETLQEIVQFREMLSQRIEQQDPPLAVIPQTYKPVIAKLAHESDKTLAALTKYIRLELLPTQDDEEVVRNETSPAMIALPQSTIEITIKAMMQRNNYGLDGIGGAKPPAAVCVWRWEVKEQYWEWLPKSARDKAESRHAERVQAKKDLLALFESFSPDEKTAILDPKGTNKLPPKDTNVVDLSKLLDLTGDDKPTAQTPKANSKDVENEENDGKAASKAIKAPKPVDPEKALKEQLKLEKKAAKAEKEKKEQDARKKSQNIMANFFSKPKKVVKKDVTKVADASTAGPSTSAFERTFKPFVLKKDVTLAPTNWFSDAKKRKRSLEDNGIIIIEDDVQVTATSKVAVSVGAGNGESDLGSLNVAEHIRSIVSSLPPPPVSSRRRVPVKGTKTYKPISVRDIMSQLSEAEVAGDTSLVRSLLERLSDRSLLPAKVFIFHSDARPGYFGTWTRSSRIIGPRTPLAKDVVVFDYSYDSGEEWEEEAAGDADDVVEEGEDEDADEEPDSDLDSWLVDDDTEDVGIPLDDRDSSPPFLPDFPPQTTKRKADDGEKKSGKKRKIVIPLVPFAKGPCWETSIGHCESDILEPYRIQLFNDTPFPVDPFTFVSAYGQDGREAPKPAPSNDGFVMPCLPKHLTNGNGDQQTNTASAPAANPAPKKPPPAPKTVFPDAHLPLLLKKIHTLQAASINFLVEAIHRELRDHKVKKNTIEAKIREVGEKCKEKKFWIVKSGIHIPS